LLKGYADFLLRVIRDVYGISRKGLTILEVGSGSNHIFDGKDCFFVAADYSHAVLKQDMSEDIRAVCCDIRSLPFKSGCFDVVISNNVLHHLKHEEILDESMREISRVLMKDGLFCLTDRNPESGALVRGYSVIVMSIKKMVYSFTRKRHHGSLNEPMLDEHDYLLIMKDFRLQKRVDWYNFATSLFYNMCVGLISLFGEKILGSKAQAFLIGMLAGIENMRFLRGTNLSSSMVLRHAK
jgi:SAM-dependent methyltransferase